MRSGFPTAGALLVLLVLAPVAFGLVENWAAFSVFAVIDLAALTFLLTRMWGGERTLNRGSDLHAFRFFVGFSALSLLWSANRNLTLKHVLYLLACYLVFFLFANIGISGRALHGVLWSLSTLTALLSVYGLVMAFSANPMVLNRLKTAYKGCVTATFINKNHFAGFLEMMLFVTLGLFLVSGKKNSYGLSPVRFSPLT